ncbi:Expansin-like A2, partial [Linum perenne]
IQCKNPSLCSSTRTTVMVMDLNTSNSMEFVLSSIAFRAMASKGKASDVLKLDLNVEDFMVETMAERSSRGANTSGGRAANATHIRLLGEALDVSTAPPHNVDQYGQILTEM